MDELCEIKGTVEAVTFHNADNGFSVLELECGDEYITAVGVFSDVYPGEALVLQGRWDTHSSFGRQFRVKSFMRSMPSSSADLLKYLSAGTIKGIGPATALKIVEMFGDETLSVIEKQPERLAKIKGITLQKAKKISEEFNEQFAVREVMIALERYGMTPTECINAFRLFGAGAVETVRRNPYILCGEGVGVGFERADAIAAALDEPPDSGFRLRAGIVHVVRHNLANGHTCVPREKLIRPALELLGAGADAVEQAIDSLVQDRQLVSDTLGGRDFLFLPFIYFAETSAAKRIKMMCCFPPAGKPTILEEIERLEAAQGIRYEDRQRQAIITAIERGMLILTGGPGTGKTTTLNGILELFSRDGLRVQLAAPTGRAAKRMSQITGREAKTIHRLLEVEWDKNDRPVFQRNMQNPIEADALIVDELSMVDIQVFSSLLDALPLGCRLVMVGDSDQLPPVGAGNVLHDLIDSELLPVVQLTEVFRQAQQSLIVTNAHRIVKGIQPLTDVNDRDFFFMERNNPVHAQRTVAQLCAVRLPDAYGFSPLDDIQVLCPSRKGVLGTVNLNKTLQAVINPKADGKREIVVKGCVLRVGDKVMQVKNNYDIPWEKDGENGTGVFNGDIGTLETVGEGGTSVAVRFDEDRIAEYTSEQAQDLELAYAVTVHKSQGNEFEAVVLPLLGVVPQLAYRNLLYTAVTRAKSLLIIVGNKNQLAEMVNNNRKAKRYSALKYFLSAEE